MTYSSDPNQPIEWWNKNKKYFIGIDNGLDGGIICIDEDYKIIGRYVMPTIAGKGSKREYDINEIIKIFNALPPPALVILEKAQAYPGQGTVSQFNIGKGYGIMMGILECLYAPYQLIHPKTWQARVFEGLNRIDTKQASALFCARIKPKEDWRVTERSKKSHSGLTDAFCIAYYAKLIY